MSFFKKTEPNSPEDRLSALEKVWPTIVEKIKSYDKVLDEFSALRKQLGELKSSIESSNSSVDELRSSLNEHKQDQDNHDAVRLGSLNAIVSKLKEIEDRNAINSSVVSTLAGRLDDHMKSTSASLSNLVSASELEKQKVQSQQQIDPIKTDINAINMRMLVNENRLQDLGNSLRQAIDRHSYMSGDVLDLSQKFRNLGDQVSLNLQSCAQSSQSVLQKLTAVVESKLADFKSELAAVPSPIDGLRQEFFKKLESVALDGSNAVLKATNSSQQIQILEKKIENIMLLIKKYELSK